MLDKNHTSSANFPCRNYLNLLLQDQSAYMPQFLKKVFPDCLERYRQ